MAQFGGMQLLAAYKAQLDPRFLEWYLAHFTNTRIMYLHWPVECCNVDDGHYNQVVGMVNGQTQVWDNFSTDPTDATYGRNTNSFAIALAGFAGAQTDDLGRNCATPAEVDALLAQCVQVCLNQRIPVSSILTHAEAADNVDQGPNPPYPAPWAPDPAPYGPLTTWERWDIHVWIDPASRQLYAPLADHPAGTIYFPDWLRGEAALRIQQATQKYWQTADTSSSTATGMEGTGAARRPGTSLSRADWARTLARPGAGGVSPGFLDSSFTGLRHVALGLASWFSRHCPGFEMAMKGGFSL